MANLNLTNFTNFSTTPPLTPAQPDILFNNLIMAGYVFVYYCVAIHAIYLILVVYLPDLRTRALVFINHAIFANSLYPLGNILFFYIDPNTMTNNPQLVSIICSFFEIFWPFAIYSRMYSILLIAVHRYLAVFQPEKFRKLNNSRLFLSLSILIVWIISLSLSFVLKHAFSTSYSLTMCLAGFSKSFINSLISTLLYVFFALILPTIAIVVIYVIIACRLSQLGKNLSSNSNSSNRRGNIIVENMSLSRSQTSNSGGEQQIRISKKREMRFANQFILMCVLVVLTILGIAVFSFRGIIPNYFNVMYYWRSVIRCYIMFFSALVPVFSLYYNPSRSRLVRYLKSKTSTMKSQQQTIEIKQSTNKY